MLRELEGRLPNTPAAKSAFLHQYASLLENLEAGSSGERAALAGIARTIPLVSLFSLCAYKHDQDCT